MTENEAKLILDVRISRFDHADDVNKALEVAKTALEEIQQYRSIGTVEECREARERQIPKKPLRFYKEYGKHKWKRNENGDNDTSAWSDIGHNGVKCKRCGAEVCVFCNPNYDELENCKVEYWTCPRCGKHIHYGRRKYCKCGQRLEWPESTS